MLTFHQGRSRLCDGLSRRETLRVGGLGLLGVSMADLLARPRAAAASAGTSPGHGKARSCIVLFLMGGPPQHSTWDPKPDAPAEVRGDFAPIATTVPGLTVGELMPRTAMAADKACVLRAMSSGDNAHSSSGYFMLTGYPHEPMNFENANPGAPNDYPSLGALVRRLKGDTAGLPAAVTLPQRIFNTNGSVWPGQDAGFLGRSTDPWLLRFDPSAGSPRVDEFSLPDGVSGARFESRRSLLQQVNQRLDAVDRGGLVSQFDRYGQQAFELLRSTAARRAFDLEREEAATRDRYGRTPFGNSVLLARRLVEAGVSLIQVNWYRGPDEPADNPCWDSHTDESHRLKNVLMPPMDQAYSALLEDLAQRGLLDETLVVWMAEFGRTPKINARAGRDHWGFVYSVALAGGGVRGGQVLGASDKLGGQALSGRVSPRDLSATIFHCLGHEPSSEFTDPLGRPLPISRGEVIQQVF